MVTHRGPPGRVQKSWGRLAPIRHCPTSQACGVFPKYADRGFVCQTRLNVSVASRRILSAYYISEAVRLLHEEDWGGDDRGTPLGGANVAVRIPGGPQSDS